MIDAVKEIDQGGDSPANYIEGIHPETGEVIRVRVTGNFPFKDPKTNHFVIDAYGKVVTPGRERLRFSRLDHNRQEILDPRPMSSAVAFAQDISPDEEVRRLIASADARMAANMARADESDQDFYDDDDFEVEEGESPDNRFSPFEFVRDAVAGRDVPRHLAGMFKSKPEASSASNDAQPLPPKGKAAKPSKKAPSEPPIEARDQSELFEEE